MQCVFVQIRCKPGTVYDVAFEISLKELHSELYSTSGDYDLMMKVYIPEGEDVGRYLNEGLFGIPGIERTLTTMTFNAFTRPTARDKARGGRTEGAGGS